MRRFSTWATWSLVLLTACKAQVAGAPGDDDSIVDAPEMPVGVDAATPGGDGPVALGKWGPAKKIDVASGTASEDDVTLSSDTLEMFFAVEDGANGKNLFHAKRVSASDDWTRATAVSFNSDSTSDETPRLSADDKTLYFASGRSGNLDIWKTTRSARGMTDWSAPTMVTSVSTTAGAEKWFMPCGADHYVMVRSVGTADSDLVEGTLGGAAPTAITKLNSTGNETGTFVSSDCLTIYYASTRVMPTKLFRARRASLTAPWDDPVAVDDFPLTGGDGNQEDPWMSSDSRTFVFVSNAAGTKDVYISTR